MQNKQAFTLIELLVVVLIIGILAAIAVPQYEKAVLKSRLATLKYLTKSIAQAEEIYRLATGEYIDDFSALDIEVPGGQISGSTPKRAVYDWGSCQLRTQQENGYYQVYCRRDYMGYLLRLKHSKEPNSRLCVVFTAGPEIAKRTQVCQQETGSSTIYASNDGEGNSYTAYLYND